MLFGNAVLYVTLTMYIEVIRPGKFGVKKSPCFCFKNICKKRQKVENNQTRGSGKEIQILFWLSPALIFYCAILWGSRHI